MKEEFKLTWDDFSGEERAIIENLIENIESNFLEPGDKWIDDIINLHTHIVTAISRKLIKENENISSARNLENGISNIRNLENGQQISASGQ